MYINVDLFQGDYHIRMEVRDHTTQDVLACFEVTTGVEEFVEEEPEEEEEEEEECTGWFCF